MTQCAVEERLNLRLAIQGLVTYAETLSVYGTEAVFVDGDDTPWSKAFLASAYASRGVKVRFTSGGGSEALMGESEGKSMLYLEARCLSLVRAAGSQGVQNGSISCVALALAVPGGTREVLAENVLAAWLDLEVASGNDAIASHSEIRKTAKLMGQFLPGTDFVTSGYSSMPRYDNMFGGGNYDSHDLDEWLTIQRDWQVDAGHRAARRGRRARGARARGARGPGGLRRARLPADHRRGGAARDDVPRLARPARPRPRRRRARGRPRARDERISGLDVARALDARGFADVADAVFEMQRQRVAADYLQTSAIIARRRHRRLGGQRPEPVHRARDGLPARGRALGAAAAAAVRDRRAPARRRPSARAALSSEGGAAATRATSRTRSWSRSARRSADALGETINGLAPRRRARGARSTASRARARTPRLVRIRRSADVAFIGHDGALLSGSGIAVGLQSKGTALIHRADLQPLDNLELFGMAPSLTLDSYRQIGAQRRRLRARPPGRAGADGARQLRPREADRAHDAAARARGGGGRPRRQPRSTWRSCGSPAPV